MWSLTCGLWLSVCVHHFQDIAKFLATSAQEVGQSTSRRSPFADAVEASGYVGYTGGKLDDVTVIVSHVQKKSSCYLQ